MSSGKLFTASRTLCHQQKMVGSYRKLVHLAGLVTIRDDNDDLLHSPGRCSQIRHLHLARTVPLRIAVDYKEERRDSFWLLRWIQRKGRVAPQHPDLLVSSVVQYIVATQTSSAKGIENSASIHCRNLTSRPISWCSLTTDGKRVCSPDSVAFLNFSGNAKIISNGCMVVVAGC